MLKRKKNQRTLLEMGFKLERNKNKLKWNRNKINYNVPKKINKHNTLTQMIREKFR